MNANALNLNNLRLAVLIDAENVPRNCLKSVMEEVAIYGTPTIKRIYGDWTSPMVAGWKNSLLDNAITPIQQYSYTTGKNSSDSAMIIDAMDILYTEKTDGFVIVSSDSDFTRLAIRLREAGQRVIGIGERKTPSAFIAACDKFTYIEVIRAGNGGTQHGSESARSRPAKTKNAASTQTAAGSETAATPPAANGEAAPGKTPVAAAQTTPGTASIAVAAQTAPGTAAQTASDAASGKTPIAAAQTASDAAQTASDAASGKTPVAAAQTAPGAAVQTTPGADSAQTPNAAAHNQIDAAQSPTDAAQSPIDADASAAAPAAKAGGQQRDKQHGAPAAPRQNAVPEKIIRLIADSVADLAGDDGVVFMGELGNLIIKKQPDFDNRNFGFKSLSAMIKSIDRFEIDFRQTTDPNIKHVFVRDKDAAL